jgi:hypothetical protein
MTGPVEIAAICDQDRELLDLWAELGMPDDQSTRDYALGLLMKLWAAYRELDAALGEVLALEHGETPPEIEDVARTRAAVAGAASTPLPASPAEEKIVDLMVALETSVNEAKAARDRHRAADPAGGEARSDD